MDRFVLRPVPADAEPANNEHRLDVPDCLLLRRGVGMEFRAEALARLIEAVPGLCAIGSRGSIPRAPSEDDIARLRALAEWYGFPIDLTTRTDQDLTRERQLSLASKKGRYPPQ